METIFCPAPEHHRDYLELLLLADPDMAMLDRYLDHCRMVVLEADGEPVCEVCLLMLPDGVVELKNVATRPDREGRGYATRLIREALAGCRERAHTAIVGTSPAGVGFYRRLGFEPYRVEPGFFLQYHPLIYENGRLLEDMIYLRRPIKEEYHGKHLST